METPQIALYIEGTPTIKEGLHSMVVIGRFPMGGQVGKEDELIHEPISYSICHTHGERCFSLIDRNVKPFGSPRRGRLSISIAIPKELQFANGQGPYTLLKEIYNTFVALYMWEDSDGSHLFNEGEQDRDVFQKLLKKYRLDPTKQEFVPMMPDGPTAIIAVKDKTKLAELMRDSDYPEFKEYGRVEIGSQVASTINIEIPRKKQFRIILNGVPSSIFLSNPTDTFDSSNHLKDTETLTYRNSHVRFTLQELMDAPEGTLFGGKVRMSGNQILCLVASREKEVVLSTEIIDSNGLLSDGDKENVRRMLNAGIVKVLLKKMDVSKAFTTPDRRLVVPGKCNVDPVLFANNDYSFTVARENDRLKLYVNKKKRGAVVNPVRTHSKKYITILSVSSLMGILIGMSMSMGFRTVRNMHERHSSDLTTVYNVPTTPEETINTEEPVVTYVEEPVAVEAPTPDYRDQIVTAANNRDWTKMERLVKKAYQAKQIDPSQKKAIEHFWWGTDKPLTPSQKVKRDKALEGKQFRTFEDLVEFLREYRMDFFD